MTLYFVQTAQLDANSPRGAWHACVCPGTAVWSLCLVMRWADDTADDDWEVATNAQAVYAENLGNVVPPIAVTALGPWGVVPTDTIRQALRKVKHNWPVIAHVVR
jgi:hypothetical protein